MMCPECKEGEFKMVEYRAAQSSYSSSGPRSQSAIFECKMCGHREVF